MLLQEGNLPKRPTVYKRLIARIAATDRLIDSVENQDYKFRIDHLRKTAAHVKFLSLEPLLGPLPDLDLHSIDWVIVGGESGPGARPMDEAWVIDIRDQCQAHDVPFFFKQWGGFRRKEAGRELKGRTWNQMPRLAPAGI